MSMSSDENPGSPLENVNQEVETRANQCQPSRKKQGKVPKRIHKAEREKRKREHLNDLFLSLANVLELPQETNGKASVLNEATRIVKDMLSQVESLREENAALLSESEYVTTEREELQDENASFVSQIAQLQSELKERMGEAELDLNTAPEYHRRELSPHYMDDCARFPAMELALQQAQNLKPFYVIPLCSDPSVCPQSGNADPEPRPVTTVSKPQARYPTPGDSWPSQLLEKHPQSG